VRRLGAPYRLIAVGGGPTPPSGERVTVLPPVAGRAELATLVASADAFVHAGDQETFGMSIVEALACGVPVVGCAREGVGELIDSQVGLAVDDARSEKFAEGIAALFAADLPAMRQAARIRGEEYDWRLILPCLWQHYHRLLGRTGPCPALPVAAA
jgi:alpha-1,6-mannosyltransferase